jgi:hypothetical protein
MLAPGRRAPPESAAPAGRSCNNYAVRHADDNKTVLYEVNLDADAAIEAPFDTWLRDHIADMLQFDGFHSAEILVDESPPPGRVRRTVQYRLRDQAALDRYLRDHALQMRQRGVELFGDRFTAERRVLAHREEFVRGRVSTENCLNCGEVLTGQHCSYCGQRAKVRVLSLGSLLHDLFSDLTEWDSRMWRTLRPLVFKPGHITREYLRGRRTMYSPPFRMYLVLSLAFFLTASIGVEPQVSFQNGTGINLQIGNDAEPGAALVIDDATEGGQEKSAEEQCRELQFDLGPLKDEYEPRLREACVKMVADSGSFYRALAENVPTMMFIFLPLIAGIMLVLYLGSGRYYVEHLLFFVHFHAFFFLSGFLVALLGRIAGALDESLIGSIASFLRGVLMTVLAVYVPYYLYRAMRTVYGQGRFVTLVKFSLLGFCYVVFMTLTMVGVVVYTMLSL